MTMFNSTPTEIAEKQKGGRPKKIPRAAPGAAPPAAIAPPPAAIVPPAAPAVSAEQYEAEIKMRDDRIAQLTAGDTRHPCMQRDIDDDDIETYQRIRQIQMCSVVDKAKSLGFATTGHLEFDFEIYKGYTLEGLEKRKAYEDQWRAKKRKSSSDE
eukprot:gnl/TRDRNA2_/TRDRNA2_100152_c0_seq1.p1 gnl/TRDRNA2_/TRDRNA2_100152_c0~~gnl/TRDRNA2_/TRDRNA2_100152_c0_seq1.p1  ORF type:complete len:155 (-),score=41.75 gnl/TRDRNA2_/TRDRNA2_100152_c0_seq1:31-495(-)